MTKSASSSSVLERQLQDRKSLARAITALENDFRGSERILEFASRHIGNAQVVGITGPPGVGKSTLIDCCIPYFRKAGKSVAVLAIDPSSHISGGAILGDRLRMSSHAEDEHVFVRSVANRGHMGGLTATTLNVINLFDAACWDLIIIETVGTGQSEIEVAEIADTTVVVQSPMAGDSVQAIKAGILEIADILVVNKSDLPNADIVEGDLKQAISLHRFNRCRAVLKTDTQSPSGIVELVDEILDHRDLVGAETRKLKLLNRNRQRLANTISKCVERELSDPSDQRVIELMNRMVNGEFSESEISDAVLKAINSLAESHRN